MPRDHLSFQLSEAFIEGYAGREVEWGFPIGGGNTLGEINFIDKYSLVKDDGTKERWFETCRRTVEGTYSILKNWCLANKTPWYHPKAQRAAEEMYDRQFRFLWTPPGRGLFKMGTPFVFEEGSASLQNCAFISTENLGPRQPTLVFCRMMEMSMLGVGVGFDVRGAGNLTINKPQGEVSVFQVPDSREGWCDSVDHLLRSFFVPNQRPVAFDYSLIRPAGMPLRRFGGFAGGPGPLRELHERISALLTPLVGTRITVRVITDLMNVIGCCVVAGNLRRSSQIALGDPDDKEFLDLKNIEVNPERMGVTRGPDGEIIWGDGWGRLSNNSVMRTRPGINLDHLPERIAANGEPGIYDLYLAQLYGRMVDGPQWSPQGMGEDRMPLEYRVKGGNPCMEQPLEPWELCTLSETYPIKHDNLEDYLRTLKHAYLYAKAVTLMPTHWPESNEVMQRNRRIGLSMSGVAQFVESRGVAELRRWCDTGYKEVCRRDRQYSEWLGVRESIKHTSVKPSGTVSLLAGVTPGVHWPPGGGTGNTYIRRIRLGKANPLVEACREAGYHVEPDVQDPDFSVIVAFPTRGPDVRPEREVSVWEKAHLAAILQEWWADNMVSATLTFRPDEEDQVGPVIRMLDGALKTMSFLPLGEEATTGAYPQMPYEGLVEDELERVWKGIRAFDVDKLYVNSFEPVGESGCSNDVCEVPAPTTTVRLSDETTVPVNPLPSR